MTEYDAIPASWTAYPLTEAEAEAAFEQIREHNRDTDPRFTGSVWDTEWARAQPYIRNLVMYGNGLKKETDRG